MGSEDLHSIDLDVDVSEHRAQITAGAPFYGVKANASIGIASPYYAEADLHIDDADISSFPSEKLKDLSGHVTAIVMAAGNLSDIESAVVRADVPELKLDWRDHAITNDKPIQLGYANREADHLPGGRSNRKLGRAYSGQYSSRRIHRAAEGERPGRSFRTCKSDFSRHAGCRWGAARTRWKPAWQSETHGSRFDHHCSQAGLWSPPL